MSWNIPEDFFEIVESDDSIRERLEFRTFATMYLDPVSIIYKRFENNAIKTINKEGEKFIITLESIETTYIFDKDDCMSLINVIGRKFESSSLITRNNVVLILIKLGLSYDEMSETLKRISSNN